jgi:BioD-like phosphotransacetylase family protein
MADSRRQQRRDRDLKQLYIAATGQNRGKTTLSVGLIDALVRRGLRVGFIKPVGQRYARIQGKLIDEDAVLIDSIFHCGADLEDMSPIAIEKGFTQSYIAGQTDSAEQLLSKLQRAIERVRAGKDVVIVEGTGHAGVGAVFDLCNPAVAAALGLKAVIVSGGGIGKPIDEIVLNRALFREHSVEVVGAIVNQVDAANFDKVNSLARSGLGRLGIDVLGVMPFVPLLSCLTMELIVEAMQGELIAGKDKLDLLIKHIVVGAMTPHRALDYLEDRTLVITPGDRDDILLAVLSLAAFEQHKQIVSGLILTAGLTPHPSIMRLIEGLQIPTYVVPTDTYVTASEIHDLLIKIRPSDTTKIAEIVRMVAESVDVDALLERI